MVGRNHVSEKAARAGWKGAGSLPARASAPRQNAQAAREPPNELRQLLEPHEALFLSPQPVGSFADLPSGQFNNVRSQRQNTEAQLQEDLARCNLALRDLITQNAMLRVKLQLANMDREGPPQLVSGTVEDGIAEEVVGAVADAGADADDASTEKDGPGSEADDDEPCCHQRYRQPALSGSESGSSDFRSDDSFDSSSDRDSGFENGIKHNMALVRLADQEMAVYAYREMLEHLGGQLCLMEQAMARLTLQAQRMHSEASLELQAHDEDARQALEEREEMLDELRFQVEEAEGSCDELRKQVELAEQRATRNKCRADAKIAELNMVIAVSHSDVQRLMKENKALRVQLEIERRRLQDVQDDLFYSSSGAEDS